MWFKLIVLVILIVAAFLLRHEALTLTAVVVKSMDIACDLLADGAFNGGE